MAGFATPELRLAQPSGGWFDRLASLLTQELAPSSRKLRTALRMTTIATLGAGLITSCHVNNQLGTYIVWLLVGAGPMMSLRRASAFLIAEAFALAASVVLAGILVESPWLLLPFLFAIMALSTYLGSTFKLGAALLLIQVVCLDTFYTVVFAPDQIGWAAGGIFGGSVIAFGTIVLFDNWLWPDLGQDLLLEALGASVARDRLRLFAAVNFYLDRNGPPPPLPPPTSDLPAHMDLLNRAIAEGVSVHRQAILLAAITRIARIGLEVDRLIFTARQNVPEKYARCCGRKFNPPWTRSPPSWTKSLTNCRPTSPLASTRRRPPRASARARRSTLSLRASSRSDRRISARSSTVELENFAAFTDSLAVLTGHIERLLDEPPQPPAATPANIAGSALSPPLRIPRLSASRSRSAYASLSVTRSASLTQRADLIYDPDDGPHHRAADLRRRAPQDESANRRRPSSAARYRFSPSSSSPPTSKLFPPICSPSSSSSTSPPTPHSPADVLPTRASKSARPSPWCSPA